MTFDNKCPSSATMYSTIFVWALKKRIFWWQKEKKHILNIIHISLHIGYGTRGVSSPSTHWPFDRHGGLCIIKRSRPSPPFQKCLITVLRRPRGPITVYVQYYRIVGRLQWRGSVRFCRRNNPVKSRSFVYCTISYVFYTTFHSKHATNVAGWGQRAVVIVYYYAVRRISCTTKV